MLVDALAIGLTLLAIGPILVAMYLLFLTVAACIGQFRSAAATNGPALRRFAILIPAHNEQALIGRLLDNLSTLEYPAAYVDVWVVADNCDDRTATIARLRSANVVERHHPTERAKGFALRWLLQCLADQGRQYDAYVVLDADSVVARNFLACMDAHLSRGSQVIQAYYSVLNAYESPLATVRFAALAAIHFLRPVGRASMGLSVGLKGNGMCFAASVIQQFAWNWFTLAEDVEFHLALVRAGLRVDFAGDTWVLADMPVTLAQAGSQNERWERGRMELVRMCVPGLLATAFRKRSVIALDAAIEQLIPPLSVPLAVSALCLATGAAFGLLVPVVLGGLSLAGQIVYLLAGLAMVRAPLRAYGALGYAPIYLVWKLGLYGRALLMPRAQAWVRTARSSDAA